LKDFHACCVLGIAALDVCVHFTEVGVVFYANFRGWGERKREGSDDIDSDKPD